jgi:hypothetical protein
MYAAEHDPTNCTVACRQCVCYAVSRHDAHGNARLVVPLLLSLQLSYNKHHNTLVYTQAGESKVSELQQRLLSLEQCSAQHSATAAALTAGDLVSLEQVQVMESLFMETIDKLSLRVGQLERSSSGGDLGTVRGLQEGLGGGRGSASNVARLRGFR